MTEQTIACPFCGESDFDTIGLGLHFDNGYCPVYKSRRDTAREESLVQGFADCESLIVAMLSSMADREQLAAASEEKFGRHVVRMQVLREAALAVSVGQHRTDTYDEDAVAKAHQEAAKSHWRRKGGKASAKGLTPEQLEERARNAATARWTGKGEPK